MLRGEQVRGDSREGAGGGVQPKKTQAGLKEEHKH